MSMIGIETNNLNVKIKHWRNQYFIVPNEEKLNNWFQIYIVKHILSSIYCQIYIVKHILSNIHWLTYIVKHTLSSIHCQTYIVKHTLSNIHSRTCMVKYALSNIGSQSSKNKTHSLNMFFARIWTQYIQFTPWLNEAGVNILQNHSKLFPDGVYRQQTFPQNYARFATFPKAVQMVFPFFITVIILFWS